MVWTFDDFFSKATGFQPYEWQKYLAANGFPDLLPVPTGLGKTEGAVLSWAWRLLQDKGEPRHLVYCLPMRTLVRQTVERVRECFHNAELTIKVYELMGGAIEDEWASLPDHHWVLVGTQDQLLSRSLNRGYAMSRFEWPVHFGLLNNDCRWIIDEVQLMGPGLWTTAQLDWMRRKRFGTVFDCPTTWMSATVGESFLNTLDRQSDGLGSENCRRLPGDLIKNDPNPEIQRRLAARKSIQNWSPDRNRRKSARRGSGDFRKELADAVKEKHVVGTLSLVICNTVDAAQDIFENLPADGLPKVLLTSRFRQKDREEHERKLLEFEAKRKQAEAARERAGRNHDMGKPLHDNAGLICVSTQVVEAGVDVSAHHLWSEVAPWPSVIQRLGRLNRDGRDGQAEARFWEAPAQESRTGQKTAKGEAVVGPYDLRDIERAKKLIDAMASMNADRPFAEILEALEERYPQDFVAALQPKPEPLPRALDVHGLFSTERDVHGGFTDVSPFVRGTDPDSDLIVVWRDWEGAGKKPPPSGDELDGPPLDIAAEGCPVPFYRLRETLKAVKAHAWQWNEEDERWDVVQPDDLRPGMTVMLHRETGGYSKVLGWTGKAEHKLDDVPRAGPGRTLRDEEWTEIGYWVTLDVHLGDAQRKAEQLCEALGIKGDMRKAVVEAAGLHDLGKAHPQWQHALPKSNIGPESWAKCPRVLAVDLANDQAREAAARRVCSLRPGALPLPEEPRRRNRKDVVRLRWALDKSLTEVELSQLRAVQGVLWAGHVPFRPNMRHEAATALAMWHRYRAGQARYPALAVYLAATHHGKVRTVFRSRTERGDDAFGVPPQSKPLAWNGQSWPLDFSVVKDGAEGNWTPAGFILNGHGWTGLVSDLLGPWKPDDQSCAGVVPDTEPKKLGPFKLAYLEALVRIADWRASESPSRCMKPSEVRRGD